MSLRCRRLSRLHSPHLDDALTVTDRERLLTHLARCDRCRAELDDLRRVRALLHRMGSAPVSSRDDDLSSRLVSVAGSDARTPLWCRPFRRTRAGTLPRRRSTGLRRAAAALTLGGLVSGVGLTGYAAGSQPEGPALPDPGGLARAEFATTLAQIPLVSRSVNALLVSPAAALRETPTATRRPLEPARLLRPVSRAAASSSLRQAVAAADQVSFSGTQTVQATTGERHITTTVELSYEHSQGSSLNVLDAAGQSVVEAFVPATASSALDDADQLTLLLRNYEVSGWTGSTVAGRAATVVQAVHPGQPDRPAARWWIDDDTGLLLWQESYDGTGAVAWAAGFTSVSVTGHRVFLKHLAPRLAVSTTKTSLTPGGAAELADRGWACRQELVGLSLVKLRSDVAVDPGMLHMVYSDGVATLSVFEQRGRLAGPPSGSRWDAGLQAYVRSGTPTLVTWRSGGSVLTVISNGPADLVHDAVAALPHEVPPEPTSMERVRAGWARILQTVVGR